MAYSLILESGDLPRGGLPFDADRVELSTYSTYSLYHDCAEFVAAANKLAGDTRIYGGVSDLAITFYRVMGFFPLPYLLPVLQSDYWVSKESRVAALGSYYREAARDPGWWWREASIDTEKGLVHYYPTLEKRLLGQSSTMRAGRFAQKFWQFSEIEAKDFATYALSCVLEVLFTDPATEDNLEAVRAEWVRIYDSGPSSCCSNHPENPVEVYAYPGNSLRLAYATNGAGVIVARCIVRDDLKQYIRCYGNNRNALASVLVSRGYSPGNLQDVKLALLYSSEGSEKAPYLDGAASCVDVYNDHLRVGYDGEFDTQNSNDRSGRTLAWGQLDAPSWAECRETCDHCGNDFHPDDLRWVGWGEDMHVCTYCVGDDFIEAYTRVAGRIVYRTLRHDDVVFCESDSEYYAEQYLDVLGVRLDDVAENYYLVDDLVETARGWVHLDNAYELAEPDDDGNTWAYYMDCENTTRGYIHEDMTERLDVSYMGLEWAHVDDVFRAEDGRCWHVDDPERPGFEEAEAVPTPAELEAAGQQRLDLEGPRALDLDRDLVTDGMTPVTFNIGPNLAGGTPLDVAAAAARTRVLNSEMHHVV